MEVLPYSGQTQLLIIGFEPGELLLESLKKAIATNGVQNGAVISGIGTLNKCRMHYIEHTHFPAQDRIMTLEKPLELNSINGLIVDGEPHLHIVVSCGENEVYGGHLEEGSQVLYLAEIAILVFNELKMVRKLDPERRIKLLNQWDG
jgi:predicted DNA-binding protein with PD1-like motif